MLLAASHRPHIRQAPSVTNVHMNIMLALLPALVLGVMHYGWQALVTVATGVASAIISEMMVQKLFRRPVTIHDGSAALTGLLLAMLLPADAPYWLIMVGSFCAIFLGKQVFGGLGNNPFNAVLVGWAIIRLSWGNYLHFDYLFQGDAVSVLHYPLDLLKKGDLTAVGALKPLDLALGRQAGGVGASAGLALALGGLYLILRRILSWHIPVAFIAGMSLSATVLFMHDPTRYASPLFHLLTGSALMGAFFLATDYSSSPANPWAKIFYGAGCGVLVIVLRTWSNYPDGVAYAILLMNILVPYLDKIHRRPITVSMVRI